MDPRRIATIVFLLLSLRPTYGLIGYDCGSASANLTTMSLLSIDECDIPKQHVNSTRVYVQLLQLNEFSSVKVIQCKVEIDRTVKKCGMFSHTMEVRNGKLAYIEEVSREACQRMHAYGTFQIAGTYITGIRPNDTTPRPITLAGDVDDDGGCKGGKYSDLYGTWGDVLVLGTITITLQDYIADVKINTNKVRLRSGVMCELSATNCMDIEGGNTFWDPVPTDTCKLSGYGVLYEGYVKKIIDTTSQQAQTAYSLTAQNTVFTLASRGKYMTCGHTLTRTEHPKLVIYETTPGSEIFKKQSTVSNLDIFAYMNSKFVYVEQHIRSQLDDLYRNVLLQQCSLEQ